MISSTLMKELYVYFLLEVQFLQAETIMIQFGRGRRAEKSRATSHKEFEEPDSDEDESEIILNQPKMKRSRLSLKKHNLTQTSLAEQSTAMETDIFIDLTESDPDNNERSSPECIMVLPIKNEPNEDDNILIQSQLSASDTTYISTDMMDVEPYSSPTYTPQFQNVKPTSTTSMSKSATSTSEDDPLCDLDTNFDEEVLLGNIAVENPSQLGTLQTKYLLKRIVCQWMWMVQSNSKLKQHHSHGKMLQRIYNISAWRQLHVRVSLAR